MAEDKPVGQWREALCFTALFQDMVQMTIHLQSGLR